MTVTQSEERLTEGMHVELYTSMKVTHQPPWCGLPIYLQVVHLNLAAMYNCVLGH